MLFAVRDVAGDVFCCDRRMEEDRRHQDSEVRRQDLEMRRQQVDGRRHQQLLAQVGDT